MRIKLPFLFFIGLAILLMACSKGKEHSKPNVIVIYTDDQGSVDLNSYGAADLQTPNMDRIVKSGIKFTQFYAAPICSPSRASLLTGKNPQRAGLPGNAYSANGKHTGLPGSEYTMAEMFKDAGYKTALIGKWHLGHLPEMSPNAQGFDYAFGHMYGCIDNYSHFFYWSGPNKHDLYRNGVEVFYDGEYYPDLMVDESIDFIKKNKDQPFFLFFASNMPHYPYQGDQKWLNYYQKKGVEYPRDLYAAFLSTLDDRVGVLLNELDRLGLKENTIIIYQSDNGHSTEQRAHFGGGSAGPYRGAKQCLFEGGIRVPAAIAWPGKLPAGEVRDQLAVNADWMPTLAQLCAIDLDTTDLDGKSLIPIINNAKSKSKHGNGYCWAFDSMWAARKGEWKLLGNPYDTGKRTKVSQKLFLVNLNDDPGETTNLIEQYPEKAEELKALYEQWVENNKR